MKIVKDQINLLPIEEKRDSPFLKNGYLLGIVVLLGWIAAFGVQFKREWDVKQELVSLTEQKQKLFPELSRLEKEFGPASDLAKKRQKEALVEDFLTERVLWSEVFKQFSRLVPKGLWFDNLEGSSSGKTEIKIKGGALNYSALSQFMLSLEASGYFINPQLRFAQKVTVKGRDLVNYEILCETKRKAVK